MNPHKLSIEKSMEYISYFHFQLFEQVRYCSYPHHSNYYPLKLFNIFTHNMDNIKKNL